MDPIWCNWSYYSPAFFIPEGPVSHYLVSGSADVPELSQNARFYDRFVLARVL
jgi:hypothetical protein